MFISRIWNILLIAFLSAFTVACTVVPEEMNIADRLMETLPDSSLHILQHLSPRYLTSESNRAFYGLLLVRALDKNRLPLKPDTLLDFSVRYYTMHSNNELLAACCLYKARMYKYALHYEMAMTWYLKGLDIALSLKNEVLLGRFQLDMGDIYTIQNDYVPARRKYRMAYACFRKAGFQPQSFYALLNIGRTYAAAKAYNVAKRYYRQLVPLAKDSMQQGALLQEMGLNYYHSGRFDSAIFYLRQVIRYPYLGYNRAVRYKYLADLYLDNHQPDSAFYYATKSFTYNPEIRTQRDGYRIMGNCAFLKKDMKAFDYYMMRYKECSDSIRSIDAQTKSSLLESMYFNKNEVVRTRNKLIRIILLFLMLFLAVVWLLFQHRHLHRVEKDQLVQSHLKQRTANRLELIHNHGDTLHHKIEEARSKQSQIRKKASLAEKERMDRTLYDEFLHLNDIDFFYHEMDLLLNNLTSKLQTRYPTLTTKEISWCCLHLLRVPATDIYLLLDYKVGSLIKMKQRLAQKVGVEGVVSIYDFLNEILVE